MVFRKRNRTVAIKNELPKWVYSSFVMSFFEFEFQVCLASPSGWDQSPPQLGFGSWRDRWSWWRKEIVWTLGGSARTSRNRMFCSVFRSYLNGVISTVKLLAPGRLRELKLSIPSTGQWIWSRSAYRIYHRKAGQTNTKFVLHVLNLKTGSVRLRLPILVIEFPVMVWLEEEIEGWRVQYYPKCQYTTTFCKMEAALQRSNTNCQSGSFDSEKQQKSEPYGTEVFKCHFK